MKPIETMNLDELIEYFKKKKNDDGGNGSGSGSSSANSDYPEPPCRSRDYPNEER